MKLDVENEDISFMYPSDKGFRQQKSQEALEQKCTTYSSVVWLVSQVTKVVWAISNLCKINESLAPEVILFIIQGFC